MVPYIYIKVYRMYTYGKSKKAGIRMSCALRYAGVSLWDFRYAATIAIKREADGALKI